MKSKISKATTVFQPIKLEIVLETPEEAYGLMARMNASSSLYRGNNCSWYSKDWNELESTVMDAIESTGRDLWDHIGERIESALEEQDL